MCLRVNKTEFDIALLPKTCYKILFVVPTKNLKSYKFITPVQQCELRTLKKHPKNCIVTTKHNLRVRRKITGVKFIKEGLHSFVSEEDAKLYIQYWKATRYPYLTYTDYIIIYRCTIPEGIKYMQGYGIDHDQYVSQTLIYNEIVYAEQHTTKGFIEKSERFIQDKFYNSNT